jgi:Asp-tRNA(Asn)/Glu-tRNA(Gln) amidotransferase A subunit family amidase
MDSTISRRTLLQAATGAAIAAPPVGMGAERPVDPGDLGAAETVTAIRAGTLSAESCVQALLDRAERLKDLNAFITLDGAGALAAARAVDSARAAGQALPPLAGLPIVVKDNIDTAALPTTGGTPALRGHRPPRNAPSLQKLLDAGAIVLGKTNLHELAFGITSTNLSPFAGPVRNPYDRTRIAGGSSGGTAAALAARIAAAGLGTDTGGSARVPAALCGVAGLRPSVGNGGMQRRYHDAGAIVPISHTRDTVGPMGRTVADVALLDSVITGGTMPDPIGLAGLRIGIPAPFWEGIDHRVDAVMTAARSRLAAAGVSFVEVDIAGVMALNSQVSFQIALHEPIADLPDYLRATGGPRLTVTDIAQQVVSPDVMQAFDAILADVFGPAYAEAMTVHRPKMQAQYAACFAVHRLDALMFPTTILPAVPIDATEGSSSVSVNGGEPVNTFATFIRNTDPGSNAGIPGLSLHAGMTGEGLPVGLALDGPLSSDRTLLGIGLSIEALLGAAPAPRL